MDVVKSRFRLLQSHCRAGRVISPIVVVMLFSCGCILYAPPPSTSPSLSPSSPPLSQFSPEAENQPPIIYYMEAEQNVTPLSIAHIHCVAADADGDTLFYSWSADKGAFKGKGDIITWMVPEETGDYSIMAVVSDGRGGEVADSVTVTVARRINQSPSITIVVTPRDKPPVVVTSVDEPITARQWSVVEIECIADDPDGDRVDIMWSATGGRILGEGNKIRYIITSSRDHIVSVAAIDSTGRRTTGEVYFHVLCCGGG